MGSKRAFAFFLIFPFIISNGSVFAYDLSHQSERKRSGGPVTVALVPYAERSSAELMQLVDQLAGKLKRTRGLRVLPRKKTNSLLQYYFSYVNNVSKDGKADRSLSKAREALLEGNFQRAERLLRTTKAQIEGQALNGGSNEGLYEAHLLQAKIEHAKGDGERVVKSYDKIVLLNPGLTLDPNLYSKWERVALKEALQRIEVQVLGSIRLVSSPEGAEVFINGVHRGITPLTMKKLPGARYCVELKTVNHAPYTRYVDVEEGRELKLKVRLTRTAAASKSDIQTIPPSLYRTDLEISRLISTLGYHLGVDKIILVTTKKEAGGKMLVYRMGDTGLGAVYKAKELSLSQKKPAQTITLAANEMNGEARRDVLKNPAEITTQNVGSVKLHEKKRPFYKRPLFWVLVGAGTATGGALGAVLGGGGAALGGVIIGL